MTTPVRYSEEGIPEHHNIDLPFVRLVSGCCMDQTCAPESNKLCPVGVIGKRVQKGCLMGDRDRDMLHNKAAASVWPRTSYILSTFCVGGRGRCENEHFRIYNSHSGMNSDL